MTGALVAYSRRIRSEAWPVWPPALVATLVWVGVMRVFWLWMMLRFPPNAPLLGVTSAIGFWEIWHGEGVGGVPVQRWVMTVNLLLMLYLWAELRGRRRVSLGARVFQLLTYGGAALLLVDLQRVFLRAALLEPAFRVIRLPMTLIEAARLP